MTSCRPAIDANPSSIQYVTSTQADAAIAQMLGLGDFSLAFDVNTDNPNSTVYTVSFTNGQFSGNPVVTLDANGNLLSVTGSNYPPTARRIYARRVAGSSTDFTLSTTDPASATVGVTWYLSIDSSQIVPRVTCPLTVNSAPGVMSFAYTASGLSIEIEAESSHDGLQLALATITITQNGQAQTCTFYNLPLPSVMNGPGCTLFSKAQGNPLLSVVEYSLLKFALAKVLFGCYSICYLTQEWNECILTRLQVEYPEFYLILSSFVGYAELFIESCA